MTDREKLVVLLIDELEKWQFNLDYGRCDIADSLIANGVVVREKGEWMEMVDSVEDGHTGEYYEEIYYNCLNCDYASDQNTPFCPNCGADMRKGENDG